MDADSISLLDTILAIAPILTILILMVGFRWGGTSAGGVAWVVAILVSVAFFGAKPDLLFYSQLRGLFFTLFVLYIIWMAIGLYQVVREAGAISVIADQMVRLTRDRILQLLLLSWVFSSFLGGLSGFGVPIAVIAPLLIGLGFSPLTAVTAVAAGHSWAVTFGDVGAPFNALVVSTGLPGEVLAPWTAVLLGIACVGCGIAAAYSYCGFESIRQGMPAILIIGVIMAGIQYLFASNHLWNLASFMAGMGGLFSILLVRKLPIYQATRNRLQLEQDEAVLLNPKKIPFLLAAAPYLFLVLIILSAVLIQPINHVLNQVQLFMMFPGVGTSRGWFNPASKSVSISLFGHTGALLAYTALIGFGLFQRAGCYQPSALRRILTQTAKSASSSSIGIAAMIGIAMIMEQSGMSFSLAVGLSKLFKPIYPLLAPFIGLLGAFTTGSNLISNVIFGGLQKETAQLLNLPVAIILAAQTAGGSLGSMISPAKIILGCSTTGLSGKEGQVISRTFIYVLIISTVIGAITWLIAR